MEVVRKPAVIYDFKKQLEYSEKASDERFWGEIYHKAFPNMVNCMLGSADSESQRMGIDRIILLANGAVLKIDEKKRDAVYNDILLEYVSVDTTKAPGWMEKDLSIDYLAYAFMPTKTVYLFSWPVLRRAWLHYRKKWIVNFRRVEALNNGYKTISVAVPINVLQQSIIIASVIKLNA